MTSVVKATKPGPSKLTPEFQEQIPRSDADACLKAGISKSTFQLWKKKGQEQKRGHYLDFLDELKEAEAGFRATRLQRLVEAVVRFVTNGGADRAALKWALNRGVEFNTTTEIPALLVGNSVVRYLSLCCTFWPPQMNWICSNH